MPRRKTDPFNLETNDEQSTLTLLVPSYAIEPMPVRRQKDSLRLVRRQKDILAEVTKPSFNCYVLTKRTIISKPLWYSGGTRGGLGGYSPPSEHASPRRKVKSDFFGDFWHL